MLHCIARSTGIYERSTFRTQEFCYIYRDQICVVELLLQLENKQQIMQNNMETQHKHMYSWFIGSLPYGTIYLHRDFTGICENQNGIELCLL